MKNKPHTLIAATFLAATLFCSCSNTGKQEATTENNPVLSAIAGRKSVRSFIKEKPVSREDTEKLLRAGMAAPSGRDLRPWEMIVINDRATLDKMAEELPTAPMLAEVPMAIVVCGDSIRSFYWYLDCAAATQNILLAAESMGLASVWTAAYPYQDRMDIIIKHTGLPSHILPLAVLPIGYPKGPQQAKEKYDAAKVHYGKW
ncbi:MAG: nitroreductase family protein [Candidatus Azobacteroides sp.]|nr:nitroreductase family protein [Candidatus Azobacteroides sp.]